MGRGVDHFLDWGGGGGGGGVRNILKFSRKFAIN